jgi:AcrR family transcriptional regulator
MPQGLLAAPAMAAPAKTALSKMTPKSLRTRAHILDTAMRLFVEVGYSAATNPAIAQAAGLTRGAMLYHFDSREALVEAAIGHIEAARARLFEAAATAPAPPGADAAEHAIDAYWALLREPAFIAFAELEAAARTDVMLRTRLIEAQNAFDQAHWGKRVGPMIQAGDNPRFQASRDLGRFVLEGLAKGAMTYDEAGRSERLLAVVKRAVRMLNRKGDVQELWD